MPVIDSRKIKFRKEIEKHRIVRAWASWGRIWEATDRVRNIQIEKWFIDSG